MATDRGELQIRADLTGREGNAGWLVAKRSVALPIGLWLCLAPAQAQEEPPPLDYFSPCYTCTSEADAFRAGDFSALEAPIIDPGCDCPFPNNVIPQSRLLVDGAWPEAIFERNREGMVFSGDSGFMAGLAARGWTPLYEVISTGTYSHPRRWMNPAWLEDFVDAWPESMHAGQRNSRRFTGRIPLHWAALRAHPGIVERLLEFGAAVNTRASDGATPLHLARTLRVFKALRAAGADIYARMTNGYTVLHRAVWLSDAVTVRELLAAGLDPNAAMSDGWTPLHRVRTLDVLEALRAAGADVRARANNNSTVLHQAAQYGDVATVRALLAAGLDPNAATSNGLTPLHYAGSREVFDELLAAGADRSVLEAAFARDELEAARTNFWSVNRLNFAVQQVGRYLDAFWLPRLREVNPDFYAVPISFGHPDADRFPLHYAAQGNEDPTAIAALIGDASDTLGYSVNATTPRTWPVARWPGALGRPVSIAARYNGNPAVFEALLAAGANANADEGLALYFAAQNETPRAAEMVRALLAAGVDVDSRGRAAFEPIAGRHLPPVYAAAMTQNLATLDALIAAGAKVNGRGSSEHYSLLADVLSRGRFDCNYGPVAARLRAAGARAVRFTESGEVPFTPGRQVEACESASAEIQELIDEGADLGALDAQGFTALHRAASEGRSADIQALVLAGADVDARSRGGGLTALQVAVWRRASLTAVNVLLAEGAEVDATDVRGWTALHWAARDRRTDPAVVEALLEAGATVNVQDNIGHTALQYATRADIRNEAVAALLRAAGGG